MKKIYYHLNNHNLDIENIIVCSKAHYNYDKESQKVIRQTEVEVFVNTNKHRIK